MRIKIILSMFSIPVAKESRSMSTDDIIELSLRENLPVTHRV